MSVTAQIAKHIRDFHFGENWTASNLKDNISDVTWEEATTQVGSSHSIASLVYHIHYFVEVLLKVLEGGPLEGDDKLSFDLPAIQSQRDWDQLLKKVWDDAERFACHVERLSDSELLRTLPNEKYGTFYRNIHGIIEHCHYHLGQIVMLKRILREHGGKHHE